MVEISAVIPAHNEMYSVGEIVCSCKQSCGEVIVVDDGSTDETSHVSEVAGAVVLRNEVRRGIVESTQIGLRAACGDVTVTLDADGQHDPREIKELIQPIVEGQADLVLGRRCDEELPLSEKVIRKLVSSRVSCTDVGTGFRAFRADLARRMRLSGFCLCGSLLIEAHRRGARIVEVPITIGPRRYGQSHWSSPFSRGAVHCKQFMFLLMQLLLSSA